MRPILRMINQKVWARRHVARMLRFVPDQKLNQLLDAAGSGELDYISRCYCLVGFLSAPQGPDEHDEDRCHRTCVDVNRDHHWALAVRASQDLNRLDTAYRLLGIPQGERDPGRGEQVLNQLCQQRRDLELIHLIHREIDRRLNEYGYQKEEIQSTKVPALPSETVRG